jgi:hypothetical protein
LVDISALQTQALFFCFFFAYGGCHLGLLLHQQGSVLLAVEEAATSWQLLNISSWFSASIAAPGMGFNGFHEKCVLLVISLYQSNEQGLFRLLKRSLGKA